MNYHKTSGCATVQRTAELFAFRCTSENRSACLHRDISHEVNALSLNVYTPSIRASTKYLGQIYIGVVILASCLFCMNGWVALFAGPGMWGHTSPTCGPKQLNSGVANSRGKQTKSPCLIHDSQTRMVYPDETVPPQTGPGMCRDDGWNHVSNVTGIRDGGLHVTSCCG